jgi:hypothetical protein
MADSSFRIAINVQVPDTLPIGAEAFPALAYAVRAVAAEAEARWKAYANGAILPSGQVISNRTGEYARSITTRETGQFSVDVYTNLAYARAIEEGSPRRDLKTILQTSMRVRLNAQGQRYLIIPFRHGTPGSIMGNNMPVDVHNWWNGAEPRTDSRVTGHYQRLSGQGMQAGLPDNMRGIYNIRTKALATTPAWKYRWGTRITGSDLESMGFDPKDRYAKRLEGMVRFRKPGGGGGHAAHSQYLTFRVMTERSSGWIVPAQPGKWPARTVAEQIRPLAEQAFAAAVSEDVARLMSEFTRANPR